VFRAKSDLLTALTEENRRTLLVLKALPQAQLDQRIIPTYWSLDELAWHLVEAYQKILGQIGLTISVPSRKTNDLSVLEEVYRAVSAEVREQVLENFSDESLQETVVVYCQNWTRGYTFWILFLHEAHHRGQITTLLRAQGIASPDVYGPARRGDLVL